MTSADPLRLAAGAWCLPATTKQLPSNLATFELGETCLVETYWCMPGGRITHRTAPRDVRTGAPDHKTRSGSGGGGLHFA